MNLITDVNAAVTLAKVFNVDTGKLMETVPVSGSTRQQAVDMIEKAAAQLADDQAWEEERAAHQEAEWAEEQSRWDDEYFASQGMNWRP